MKWCKYNAGWYAKARGASTKNIKLGLWEITMQIKDAIAMYCSNDCSTNEEAKNPQPHILNFPSVNSIVLHRCMVLSIPFKRKDQ